MEFRRRSCLSSIYALHNLRFTGALTQAKKSAAISSMPCSLKMAAQSHTWPILLAIGLQAGILMGMLKTAARTALLDAGSTEAHMVLPSLMDRLNRVLPDVKEPQMYATFAGFRLNPDGSIFYALAAQPPILHYRAETSLLLVSTEQFPLGLLPVSGFSSDATTTASGDLLIAVTDGILEAANKADEEFGLDRLQEVIARHTAGSLPALAQAILDAARAFGKQIDDQTLLLIRRL